MASRNMSLAAAVLLSGVLILGAIEHVGATARGAYFLNAASGGQVDTAPEANIDTPPGTAVNLAPGAYALNTAPGANVNTVPALKTAPGADVNTAPAAFALNAASAPGTDLNLYNRQPGAAVDTAPEADLDFVGLKTAPGAP